MSQKGKQDPDYEECPHNEGMVRRLGSRDWVRRPHVDGFAVACPRNNNCNGKCSDRFDGE